MAGRTRRPEGHVYFELSEIKHILDQRESEDGDNNFFGLEMESGDFMFSLDINLGYRHFLHPSMRDFSYFIMVDVSSLAWHSPSDGAGLHCGVRRSCGTS